MSRPIRMSDEKWAELAAEMIEDMKKKGNSNYQGKFKYEISKPEINRTATITFTAEAFSKMLMLITWFDKEVGWYCTCTRSEDPELDEYIIDDVLVFPQRVTSVTVDSDDEKRAAWFDSLPVETLMKIKCDCHSHVNMATSPSTTDEKDMQSVFENMSDDGFRIFMIWNKKLSSYAVIFDMQKNIVFESKDIDINVEGIDYTAFMTESTSMVSTVQQTTYYNNKKQEPIKKSLAKWSEEAKEEADAAAEAEAEETALDEEEYEEYDEYDDETLDPYGLDPYGLYDDEWYDSYAHNTTKRDRRKYSSGYYGYGYY